ncbi:MAG: response regulator transcription factor [Acidobacteriota bacterium]
MTRTAILIVEDDTKTAATLRLYLENAGHTVEHVADGGDAMAAFRRQAPSLVLLDLMLPGRNGLDLCRAIRSTSSTPVILLTARSTEEDKLRGLGLGADDYITKPFSPREVVARVEAVLRRTAGGGGELIQCGALRLDLERHEARLSDRALALTPAEFRVLTQLARRPGRVWSRDEITEQALGESDSSPRAIDVHVVNLRRKLAQGAKSPGGVPSIETVYGVGYRLRAMTDDENNA